MILPAILFLAWWWHTHRVEGGEAQVDAEHRRDQQRHQRAREDEHAGVVHGHTQQHVHQQVTNTVEKPKKARQARAVLVLLAPGQAPKTVFW